ncbi:MAG: IMP cyclohydrolase [Candidatus Aenigmarchaeota archaeon]|nr:IMP cyclohydrolase [Candidatus Aenigmarchaeota archaeon]
MLRDVYATKTKGDFPEKMTLVLESAGKKTEHVFLPLYELRYGTNPHQPGMLYINESYNFRIAEVKSGKSGLSLGNAEDIFRASNLLKYFSLPACAVMKHCNPTGVAVSATAGDAFAKAWHCDPVAAYGSVVAFNVAVTKELAETLARKDYFVEVVAAPAFEERALDVFAAKKNLRVVVLEGLGTLPKFAGDDATPWIKSLGSFRGIIVLEEPFLTHFRKPEDLLAAEGGGVVTKREPAKRELENLLFAWYVCSSLRSNAIAIARDLYTVACGTGQPDRVRAVYQSVQRTAWLDKRLGNREDYRLEGSVLASDGYFPFADSIEACAESGITAIVQPGGSIRDKEIIEAADKANISMVFTGERCFSHH